MSGFLGSLVDLAGTGLSDIFSAWQVRDAQDWMQGMSNSAYQRAVKDMRAAGLNPALMMGSGGPASVQASGTAKGSDYRLGSASAEIAQKRQAEKLGKAQTDKAQSEADEAAHSAFLAKQRADVFRNNPGLMKTNVFGEIGKHAGTLGGAGGLLLGGGGDPSKAVTSTRGHGGKTNQTNTPRTSNKRTTLPSGKPYKQSRRNAGSIHNRNMRSGK